MPDAHTPFPVKEHDILQSDSTRYLILGFSGGFFRKVAKCLDLTTDEVVSIKIFKEYNEHTMKSETEILHALRCLDPDKTNIVRFVESFSFLNLYCMVFEMLDQTVWDLIDERRKMHNVLNLNEIRPVIQQLMVAFDALRSQGIMHLDLKPGNIMLVDHKHRPYRMKLCNFGVAVPESRVHQGMTIQTCPYRAPEVYLGLPLSTAVDMWAVGCVMSEMYFGQKIFPDSCGYNWMETMVHLLGQSDDWPLEKGIYSYRYFIWERNSANPGWRLRTPEEYHEATGATPQDSFKGLGWCEDLTHAVLSRRTGEGPVDLKDRQAFLSLLKCCLEVDPNKRITPREALSHTFLTMAHLAADADTSVYADIAFHLMSACPQFDLAQSDNVINDRSNKETNVDNKDNTPVADIPDPPTAISLKHIGESCSKTSADNSGLFGGDRITVRSSGYKADSESRGAGISVRDVCELTHSVDGEADNIKAAPDKPFFSGARKFQGRVKKRVFPSLMTTVNKS